MTLSGMSEKNAVPPEMVDAMSEPEDVYALRLWIRVKESPVMGLRSDW